MNLYILLLVALTYFLGIFFPLFQFSLFIPFVVFYASKRPLRFTHTPAFILGLLIDSFSYTAPFGITTLLLTLFSYAVAYIKSYLPLDRFLPFLMVCSSGAASLSFISYLFVCHTFPSMQTFMGDIVFLSFCESLIGFFAFHLLPQIYAYLSLRGFFLEKITYLFQNAK